MKIIKLEPFEPPKVMEIDGSLKSMQEVVGGLIEILPLHRDFILVINEEGKLLDLPANIWIDDRTDVILGTVFLAKAEGKDIVSLNDMEALYMPSILNRHLDRCIPWDDPKDYIKSFLRALRK